MEVKVEQLLKDSEPSKLVQVVTKQIEEGRRYFGSSGASLTHQIYNPEYRQEGLDTTLAKIGMEGEHKTTKHLRSWTKDKQDVIVVDSVHLDGVGKEDESEYGIPDYGDTDHVLIIGKDIIVIDSKAWKKRAKYSVSEDGEVLRSKKEFPGGKVRMRQAKFIWRDYFKKYGVNVQSIIVITADEVFVVRDRVWWQQAFKLTNYKDFDMWLDKAYNYIPENEHGKIYPDIVAEVVSMCVKPFNVAKELMPNAYHLIKGSVKG